MKYKATVLFMTAVFIMAAAGVHAAEKRLDDSIWYSGDQIEKEMDRVRNEVNDLLNNKFFEGARYAGQAIFSPKVDMWENDKSVTVEMNVPGEDKDNFRIKVEGNVLKISAEKDKGKEEKGKNYHLRERMTGNFYREIELPASVDLKKVEDGKFSAEYRDGILRIEFPKKEGKNVKEKEINIKVK